MKGETKVQRVLEALKRKPCTSLELMYLTGSPNIRRLIDKLRDNHGYEIETIRLPNFKDESVIYQYRLKGGGDKDEDSQCRSAKSKAA